MTALLHDEIVQTLPQLKAVACRIARDRTLADDLVQETVLRALVHADQFQPGTNLKAWLATILRNSYFTVKRGEKRSAQYALRLPTEPPVMRGEQEGHVEMLEMQSAFAELAGGCSARRWFWWAPTAFPMARPPRWQAVVSAR